MEYKPGGGGKPKMLREAALKYVPGGGEPEAEWVSAAEFKARCLRLIDQVRQGGEVVVTRYGKPVAKLVPFDDRPASIIGYLGGSVVGYDDLIAPVGEAWDADA